MGKIILTVEGTTIGSVKDGRGVTITREVNEQDSARLIVHFGQQYGVNPRTTEDVSAILSKWFQAVVDQAVQEVLVGEQRIAALAARDSVSQIVVK